MKEDNGPFIALIIFVILSVVFGFMAYSKHQELYGDDPNGSKSKDAEIKRVKDDITRLESEVADYQALAAKLRETIRTEQTRFQTYADQTAEYSSEYERRRQLVTWAENFEKQASELSGTVNKLKNETLTRVNKETTESREKMEKELQEKNTSKEAAIARLRQVKEEFDIDTKKYRQTRNYEQSGLDESKSVLSDLTQREVERADIFREADGQVIVSDAVTNMVIINRGTAAGVKNGYRFEVFTLLPGNQKLVKGYIEVRKAEPSKSECLVVRRPVLLPKDPLSAYVGKDPEELYSPFQESGNKSFTAQPLSGGGRVAMMGQTKDQPIVEGDLIQNPFYAPEKAFTYYIAGSKEMINERQKSAIRYRWTEIKNVIEFYGGKVLTAPDVSVNYVIAQKNPKTEGTDAEKAEFQKCVDLGLPVIYEWELFRFLDTK
ncbi:MAG TPA: hypothetical protein VEK08_13005 [Planctomycetota bacterium]|nr:hypothetical protein [Planctomycetota bacterium]